MGKQLISICVMAGLVAGMPALAYPQGVPKGSSQESVQQKQDSRTRSEGRGVEDAALVATSVLVSAVQIPLRAAACGATFVVAGLAYLITVFDREARQGPAGAISRVCAGPYVTSAEDLRGR